MAPPLAVGIDIGSHRSRTGLVVDGVVSMVSTFEGQLALPSWVGFDHGGAAVVGEAAERLALTEPFRAVSGGLRWLGPSKDNVEMQRARAQGVLFDGEEAGQPLLCLGQHRLTPEMRAALILAQIRELVRARSQRELNRAVFAVPVGFDEDHQRGLVDAARLAGMTCGGFIDAPTAGVLPFVLSHPEAGSVMVVDVGAEELSVGVYRVDGGDLEVFAQSASVGFGGSRLDRRLFAHCHRRILEAHPGARILPGSLPFARLSRAVEAAKRDLFQRGRARLQLRSLVGSSRGLVHVDEALDAGVLSPVADEIEAELRAVCARALSESATRPEEVDIVLLAGAQARVPRFRAALLELCENAQCPDLDPTGWSACGAAVEAALGLSEASPRLQRVPAGRLSEVQGRAMQARVAGWWAEGQAQAPMGPAASFLTRSMDDELSALMRARRAS